ncbi:hypothetical protein [Leuconostoc pseudomesenteroides]|uniref:hypothetical protein n=1 Tax=Leuconostoc pseudomesenteroides TaxID=33968 RepID=UPI0039E73D84
MINIIIDLLKVLIIIASVGTVISLYPARKSFSKAQQTWIMLLIIVTVLFIAFELISGGALGFINGFFEKIDEIVYYF